MIALSLFGVSLNVNNLKEAERFYTDALGFVRNGDTYKIDGDRAALLQVKSLMVLPLRRGRQNLHLCSTDPAGAPYPLQSASNDLIFQHCALNSFSIADDYRRLQAYTFTPISEQGPERLAEGFFAFKFRDPDGHPLELIQFKDKNEITEGGIDHTAIVVSDTDKSIAFYQALLGLGIQSRQINKGSTQDHLDHLAETDVDVVGLIPKAPSPHLELLGYRKPMEPVTKPLKMSDLAATRTLFVVDEIPPSMEGAVRSDTDDIAIVHDPDGHSLVLTAAKRLHPLN